MELDVTEQELRAAVDRHRPNATARQLLRQRMFPNETEITRVGRYVVLRFIGSGGMGQVFAAYDPVLDRKVAIKLLGHGSHAQLEHGTRMLREAQAMAKLSHPNVLQVYEAGEHERQVYIAMEFVEGRTLAAWLAGESGRTPSARMILEKFVEAGRGLAAAHRAGLVHRDFKPSNVIVDAQGSARVLDFGLVTGSLAQHERDAEAERAVSDSATLRALDVELTTTGTMLGTPAYMAPEQFDGGLVDARTDQFGFCVALFEALTGERPFLGNSVVELRRNVIAGRRAGRRLRGVSRRAAKAIERGLECSPDQRWSSMDALLDAIAPTSRRRAWSIASAALLPVAGLGGWWMVDNYERELDAQASRIATEQRARVELEDEGARGHNRRLLNTAARIQDNPQRAIELLREVDLDVQLDRSQWVQTATERTEAVLVPTQILSPEGLRSPIRHVRISPDGRMLALASSNDARLWRLGDADGPAREIALDEGVRALAFDPARPGRIALGGRGFVRVVDLDADAPALELPAKDLLPTELAFSPDGRWVVGRSGLGSNAELRLWSADGKTTAVLLLPLHGNASLYAFSSDSSRLATLFDTDGSTAIWRIDALGDLPAVLDPPRGELATALSFSPDGRTLAVGYETVGSGSAPIRLWHLDAEHPDANTPLTGHHDRIRSLAFSPDGRRLISSSWDRTARIWELDDGRSRVLQEFEDAVSVELASAGDTILSSSAGTVRLLPVDGSRPPIAIPGSAPASNGSRLAVAEGKRVFVFDLSAAPERPGLARRLDAGPSYNSEFGSQAAIDATGRWLAAIPRHNVIYVWDTRDWTLASVHRHASSGGDPHLAIAPDGRVVAGTESGDVLLWRPGVTSPVLLGNLGGTVFGCELSPHGDALLVHGAGGAATLWRLDPSSQDQGRALTKLPGNVRAAAFSPDGRSLAIAEGDTIHLWRELEDEAPIALKGHANKVTTVMFEPGGAKLLSAAKDGTARLWSVSDGSELAVFDNHEGVVNSASFDASGRKIVTASSDGNARVWSLDGGSPVVLAHGQQSVVDAVFAPDATEILTGTADSVGHRWTLAGVDGPVSVELAGNGSSWRKNTANTNANAATPLERVAFVNEGASALVLTEDSVWIWDTDYSTEALLTWMWQQFPSCPSSNWRENNLGLEASAGKAEAKRCEAMVECTQDQGFQACKSILTEPADTYD